MTMLHGHETLGGEYSDDQAAQMSRSFFINDPEVQVWPQSVLDDLVISTFAFHGYCEDVLVRPLSLVAFKGVTAAGEVVDPEESSRTGAEHAITEKWMLAFDNSPSPWPSPGGWQLHKVTHNRRFDDLNPVVATTYGLFVTQDGSYMLAREQDAQGRMGATRVFADNEEFFKICAEIDLLLSHTDYDADAERLRAAYRADIAEYAALKAKTTPNDSGTYARNKFQEFVQAKHVDRDGNLPIVGFPPAPWQPVTLPVTL
jgi:hypothetical protein